ncbi:flagellar hook-length control protein FliK [Burkholderiaceae bacterium DAT-1]|nr:flagellar hook-length control protein FliK [Burkholderiaceae bacterium DAT-1]
MIPQTTQSNLLQSIVEPVQPVPVKADDDTSAQVRQLFSVGEQLHAIVTGQLPSGRFSVQIKDQILDMNLPPDTQSGDQLQLQVTENGRGLGFALQSRMQITQSGAMALAEQSQALLSAEGSIIGQLLDHDTPDIQTGVMQLYGGMPVIQTGKELSSQIAGVLQQALEQSGLFYESHLARWISGGYSQSDLSKEPQYAFSRELPNALPGEEAKTSSQWSSIQAPRTTQVGDHLGRLVPDSFAPHENASVEELPMSEQPHVALPPDGHTEFTVQSHAALNPSKLTQSYQPASNSNAALILAHTNSTPDSPAQAGVEPLIAFLPQHAEMAESIAIATGTESQLNSAPPSVSPRAQSFVHEQMGHAESGHESNGLRSSSPGKDDVRVRALEQGMVRGSGVDESGLDAKHVTDKQPLIALSEISRPIVQRQLDQIDQQRLVFQGQAWQGQPFEWQVARDGKHEHAEATEHDAWWSKVRLTMPVLGEVSATVRLQGNRVSVHFASVNDETAHTIREAVEQLQLNMHAAGLELAGCQIRSQSEG